MTKFLIVLLNILSICLAAMVEYFLSVLYLAGEEAVPSQKEWIVSAVTRFCLSLAVAAICSVIQYFGNRSLLDNGEVQRKVLKRISYGTFAFLALLGLIFSIRFFLAYG